MARYVDNRRSVDKAHATVILNYIEVHGPKKPWTIVAELETENMCPEEFRKNVLRPMILEGVLTPNADGDIRIMDIERLENLM